MALTKKEEEILKSIIIPSESNPNKPEFPPDKPSFPATPTFKIKVPGFSNVWLKDDSINKFSGTHKDRLAWEVIILYRNFLLAKKHNQTSNKALPRFSIISSGSSALAIGRMLEHYKLPVLKVLVDKNIDRSILGAIEASHCEVYKTDLGAKQLSQKDIFLITKNKNGFDLTSNQGVALEIGNYDWMGYEILNSSPDYCFMPFGTGTVYKKVLELNKLEIGYAKNDPRFKGEVNILRNCDFMGVTTNNPRSKADKLFAHHLPFNKLDNDWIKFYKESGFCGKNTGIYLVKEKYLNEAMKLAKSQGINCEPSGISGLALLLQMKEVVPNNKKILIVNTGKLRIKQNEKKLIRLD
jgi:hypothetical protein